MKAWRVLVVLSILGGAIIAACATHTRSAETTPSDPSLPGTAHRPLETAQAVFDAGSGPFGAFGSIDAGLGTPSRIGGAGVVDGGAGAASTGNTPPIIGADASVGSLLVGDAGVYVRPPTPQNPSGTTNPNAPFVPNTGTPNPPSPFNPTPP